MENKVKDKVLLVLCGMLAGVFFGILVSYYFSNHLPIDAYLKNLIWITLLSGVLGGIVNYLLNEGEKFNILDFFKSIVIGILAAALVPLFLNMLSSDLVTDIRGNESQNVPPDPYKYFVFLGFCLIAAVSSRSFIQNLSDRILNEVKKVKADTEEAKVKSQIAAETTEKLEKSVTPIIEKETEPDTPTPEISAEASEALVARPDHLGEKELKVLSTLTTQPYTFRSKNGIVKESNLSGEEVDRLLFELTEHDYVRLREGKNGARWSITQTGRAVVSRLTSTG